MDEAADALEALANQTVPRGPPLSIARLDSCLLVLTGQGWQWRQGRRSATDSSLSQVSAWSPQLGGLRGSNQSLRLEAPNALFLRRERLEKLGLEKYRSKRKAIHVYRAAAKLWQEGVEWAKALTIVEEAFDGVYE